MFFKCESPKVPKPVARASGACREPCAPSCPTLHSMDCSLPGSSVHGISQARELELVVTSFTRGSFPTQESNPHLMHWRADSAKCEFSCEILIFVSQSNIFVTERGGQWTHCIAPSCACGVNPCRAPWLLVPWLVPLQKFSASISSKQRGGMWLGEPRKHGKTAEQWRGAILAWSGPSGAMWGLLFNHFESLSQPLENGVMKGPPCELGRRRGCM